MTASGYTSSACELASNFMSTLMSFQAQFRSIFKAHFVAIWRSFLLKFCLFGPENVTFLKSSKLLTTAQMSNVNLDEISFAMKVQCASGQAFARRDCAKKSCFFSILHTKKVPRIFLKNSSVGDRLIYT